MAFPATLAAMEAAGYKRSNYSRCPGCRAAIEWWITPKKARTPMNPMPDPDSPAISHFATCNKADQFRKKEPQRCTSPTSTSQDSQPSLFLLSSSPAQDSSKTAAAASPPVVKPKQKDEN